jgi:electron transport protein HydN
VAHEGKHIFEIDPDGYDFHPKLKVVKTYNVSVPVQCKHCENPACMAACLAGAIKREEDKIVVDESKCIGCKGCAEACPFGCIEMVTLLKKVSADGSPKVVANKCDLCNNVPGGPACVRVCPTAALRLMEEENIEAAIKKRRIAAVESSALLVQSR